MKFKSVLYQKIYIDQKVENAEKSVKKSLLKNAYDSIKKLALNYTPFVGYLPVETQLNLKEKGMPIDIDTTTLASAIGLGLGAYYIGMNLDGFDMGFNMMAKARFGWGTIGEIPKYISFPFIWGGFSKEVTKVASYYLMAESSIRLGASLLGKNLGCLVGETYHFIAGKIAKKKFKKAKETKMLNEIKQVELAKEFIESERKEEEKDLEYKIDDCKLKKVCGPYEKKECPILDEKYKCWIDKNAS